MTWDELNDELEEIGLVQNRAHRVREYRRLLDDLAAGDEGYAEVLTVLAEDLLTDGRPGEAREAYQAAIDDGGRTVLNPRTGLLDVALHEGDDEQVETLLRTLMEQSRADRLGLGDYEWIGESLEEAGRLKQALRWFTIPVRDIQPGDLELLPIVCLDHPGLAEGAERLRVSPAVWLHTADHLIRLLEVFTGCTVTKLALDLRRVANDMKGEFWGR